MARLAYGVHLATQHTPNAKYHATDLQVRSTLVSAVCHCFRTWGRGNLSRDSVTWQIKLASLAMAAVLLALLLPALVLGSDEKPEVELAFVPTGDSEVVIVIALPRDGAGDAELQDIFAEQNLDVTIAASSQDSEILDYVDLACPGAADSGPSCEGVLMGRSLRVRVQVTIKPLHLPVIRNYSVFLSVTVNGGPDEFMYDPASPKEIPVIDTRSKLFVFLPPIQPPSHSLHPSLPPFLYLNHPFSLPSLLVPPSLPSLLVGPPSLPSLLVPPSLPSLLVGPLSLPSLLAPPSHHL